MAWKVTSYYHRTDPDEAGYSLGNFYEIWGACFDAAGVESVIEVGAERGRLTQELLEWAEPSGARVIAIEPAPVSDLTELIEEHPELEVVEEMSLDALGHLPIADAVVLDGDHNYYTLINELRLIAERAEQFPLLVFHDVLWPLARRDQYAAPDRIPAEHRHPYGEDIKVVPGNPGTVERGLPFEWGALEEGGPRNGVVTAIEDFMEEQGAPPLRGDPTVLRLWPALVRERAVGETRSPRSSSRTTGTRSSSGWRTPASSSSCGGTRASRRSTTASSTPASCSTSSPGWPTREPLALSSGPHASGGAASRHSPARSSAGCSTRATITSDRPTRAPAPRRRGRAHRCGRPRAHRRGRRG